MTEPLLHQTKLPAIRRVLAAYRSTAARITEEEITAAWSEYDQIVKDRSALWHGSGFSPEVVAREGLRPVTIADALTVVGVAADDPRVADYVRAKREHRWVYLTGDRAEAESYARVGGNFIANLRLETGQPPQTGWLYELDPARVGELRALVVPPEAVRSVVAL